MIVFTLIHPWIPGCIKTNKNWSSLRVFNFQNWGLLNCYDWWIQSAI